MEVIMKLYLRSSWFRILQSFLLFTLFLPNPESLALNKEEYRLAAPMTVMRSIFATPAPVKEERHAERMEIYETFQEEFPEKTAKIMQLATEVWKQAKENESYIDQFIGIDTIPYPEFLVHWSLEDLAHENEGDLLPLSELSDEDWRAVFSEWIADKLFIEPGTIEVQNVGKTINVDISPQEYVAALAAPSTPSSSNAISDFSGQPYDFEAIKSDGQIDTTRYVFVDTVGSELGSRYLNKVSKRKLFRGNRSILLPSSIPAYNTSEGQEIPWVIQNGSLRQFGLRVWERDAQFQDLMNDKDLERKGIAVPLQIADWVFGNVTLNVEADQNATQEAIDDAVRRSHIELSNDRVLRYFELQQALKALRQTVRKSRQLKTSNVLKQLEAELKQQINAGERWLYVHEKQQVEFVLVEITQLPFRHPFLEEGAQFYVVRHELEEVQ